LGQALQALALSAACLAACRLLGLPAGTSLDELMGYSGAKKGGLKQAHVHKVGGRVTCQWCSQAEAPCAPLPPGCWLLPELARQACRPVA
jgi:hypothetical protein